MFRRSVISVAVVSALTACSLVYVSGHNNKVGTDTEDMVNTGLTVDTDVKNEAVENPPPENLEFDF